MKNRVNEVINEQIKNLKLLNKNENYFTDLEESTKIIVDSILKNGKLLVCGNGGSAADAQHISAEFVGRYVLERAGYPAIALSTDTSIITAIGNDYSYDDIFSRQVEALGRNGDVLLAISTSGNSSNIINAINMAKKKGLKIIGLTGKDGGKMKNLCDTVFIFPYKETARIQEHHMMTYHLICEFVEKKLSENHFNE